MTPQQQALENDLPNVPVFQDLTGEVKELLDNQQQIIVMIKEDQAQNKAQFDEGSEKFRELYGKVEAIEMQISDGFKKMTKEFSDYKEEVKDERIKKLTDQIEKQKDKKDTMKNTVIATLIGGVLLYLAVEVLKSLNVNPPTSQQNERVPGNK